MKANAASIANLDEDETESLTIYADQIPASDNAGGALGNSILGGILMRRRMFGVRDTRSSDICNDLRELPNVLQKNFFSCLIAEEEGESEPVSSGLGNLARRMSTIRLRFQADQRGLLWNPNEPWVLASRKAYEGEELAEKSSKKGSDSLDHESTLYGNLFDLVPESPSDWIPYDPDMTENPQPHGPRFNTEDYANFYWERYSQIGSSSTDSKTMEASWLESVKGQGHDGKSSAPNGDTVSQESETAVAYDSERASKILHDTALMLKKGGNAALAAGSVMEAARRYDSAIKYCSVAFLVHPNANEDFLRETDKKWCPLRKVLLTTRLNLCMVLSNIDLRAAREQVVLALKELAPFCTKPGKVMGGKKLNVVHSDKEPISTYQEAKELQAKAYFRHGTVDMKVGHYEEAVDEFEESIKCTRELSKEPDRLVLRRLAEAKHEKSRQSKRQKKKIKRMFAQEAVLSNNKDKD